MIDTRRHTAIVCGARKTAAPVVFLLARTYILAYGIAASYSLPFASIIH